MTIDLQGLYDKAGFIPAHDESFLMSRATARLKEGCFDEGVEILQEGLKRFPYDFMFRYVLGKAYNDEAVKFKQGQAWSSDADKYQQLAAHHFGEASNLSRTDFRSAYYAATVYFELGSGKAMKFAQRSLTIDPVDANAWLRMGQIYQSLGETHCAIECYTNTLVFEPTHRRAIWLLRQLGGALPKAGDRPKFDLVRQKTKETRQIIDSYSPATYKQDRRLRHG